jgi:hypothetical protein
MTMRKILRRIHYLLNREKLERELEEEFAAHRAMMPEEQRTQFGNTLHLRERSRESWGWTWMDDLGQDVTYGWRKASRAGMAGSSDPAWARRATPIVRTRLNERIAEQILGSALHEIDARVPFKLETIESQVGHFYTRARFQTTLLFLFALIGLGLAGIGIYGLVAFLIAERTRELGVRIALGATRGSIALLVVSNAARWSFVGLVVGLLVSIFSSRLLRGLPYQVQPLDFRVYVAALTFFGIIALLAAWLPARRAARIDPIVALRHE